MNIELTWPDLEKFAANGTVEIEGVTITVPRPVRPLINLGPDNAADEFVTLPWIAPTPEQSR